MKLLSKLDEMSNHFSCSSRGCGSRTTKFVIIFAILLAVTLASTSERAYACDREVLRALQIRLRIFISGYRLSISQEGTRRAYALRRRFSLLRRRYLNERTCYINSLNPGNSDVEEPPIERTSPVAREEPTAAPTLSPTPFPTAKPTPTPTPSPTPTPTPEPTPSPTPSSTPTPTTPTPSSFPSPIYNPSLEAHSENLSQSEIEYLLNKVAFGGSERLKSLGSQGLTPLVEALLSEPSYDPDLDYWVNKIAINNSNDKDQSIWARDVPFTDFLYQGIYSDNPFKLFVSHILTSFFSVNIDQIQFNYAPSYHLGIRDHYNLIKQHSFGNFRSLLKGMLYDLAMNHWLDNVRNHKGALNQNFARELMEIYTIGTHDPVTGQANYDERSVIAATNYLSGFNKHEVAEHYQIYFDESLHDSTKLTIFPGLAAESNNIASPEALIDHILDNHPSAPRHLAKMIAGYLVGPNLDAPTIDKLGQILKSYNYELKPFLRETLMSKLFFSKMDQSSCFLSPVELLVKILRTVVHDTGFKLPRTGNPSVGIENLLYATDLAAKESGQQFMAPPSVFSWSGSCNQKGAKGEGFMNDQSLIRRDHLCIEALSSLNWAEFPWIASLGLSGTDPLEIVNQANTRVRSTFNLEPLASFLVTDNNSQVTVNLADSYYVKRKVPRLLCMLMRDFKFQRR